MDKIQYFDIITIDKPWRTVWDIYMVGNCDESVGMVIMSMNADESWSYYYYHEEHEGHPEYEDGKCSNLKECFSHFGITKWDIPLY